MVEVDDILAKLALMEPFDGATRRDVSIESLQTLPHSEVYRIRINYPYGASYILKAPGPGDVADLNRRERLFYRLIAPELPDGLTPRCAFEDEASGWLVIEDLSVTHRPVQGDIPTRQQGRSFIRALAALHGTTHRRPELLNAWAEKGSALRFGTLEERLAVFRANREAFARVHRDSLDERPLRLLHSEHLFDQLSGGDLPPVDMMVHGDAHYGNALYAGSASACLIDWGMPMPGFGEIDVAHAIAMNLPAAVRRTWERTLIRDYLNELAAHGVSLSENVFRGRYELGVLYAFSSPVSWWKSGVPEAFWRPALANLVDAVDDAGSGS